MKNLFTPPFSFLHFIRSEGAPLLLRTIIPLFLDHRRVSHGLHTFEINLETIRPIWLRLAMHGGGGTRSNGTTSRSNESVTDPRATSGGAPDDERSSFRRCVKGKEKRRNLLLSTVCGRLRRLINRKSYNNHIATQMATIRGVCDGCTVIYLLDKMMKLLYTLYILIFIITYSLL